MTGATRRLVLATAATVIVSNRVLPPTLAENGVLIVQVSDTRGAPLRRVRLATQGSGGISAPTDEAGRTRIALAPQIRPQATVALTLVDPKDMVILSPWDNLILVPPFENESQNFARVTLVSRGDRELLVNQKLLTSLIARVNESAAAKDSGPAAASRVRTEQAASEAAAVTGLPAFELDRAIRRLSSDANDPYEKGIALLYAGDSAGAITSLKEALTQRERRLDEQTRDASDAAFFLGQAFYRNGQFADAVATYRMVLRYRPGDPVATNNLGLSLLQSGDYAGAEPVLRLAIAALEIAKGTTEPDLVFSLNNLGALLVARGDYKGAVETFTRGLDIRRARLGTRDPRTANSMNNLASALLLQRNDAAAEPLLAEALSVFATQPGRSMGQSPTAQQAVVSGGSVLTPGRVAVRLNQSILARQRGAFAEAKTIAQEALRDQTQTFGPRNPETASATVVLAQAELADGEVEVAARHFEQSASVLQEVLGSDHPALVEPLVGVGDASSRQNNQARAQDAYGRALKIRLLRFGDADPLAADIAKKSAALNR